MRLRDKITIVTGAASGIGRGIALMFAKEGSSIAIWDINQAGAERVADEVKGLGQRALPIKVDVSNFAQVNEAAKNTLDEFEKVDILVNNAGIAMKRPLIEMTEAEWDRFLGIHLKGTFNCTKSIIGQMISRKSGRIISMSSISGLMGSPTSVAYGAAKAGIIGFTKSLAREVGPYGITVNAIAPGIISTPLLEDVPREVIDRLEQQTVIGRIGTPEDIAYACLYLASEEGSFVTGQVLSPNGGCLI